uniref:Uncharacterized protein n=1 Tax=Oryza sativa subsp. japonica TaxID=39947 RepID=Q6Z106_ORYSJ|nr:hypothetical protein [Oryza sativa Japonica Group]BAD33255.1 hypothetical protein [Oryza sativa Japonica Group]
MEWREWGRGIFIGKRGRRRGEGRRGSGRRAGLGAARCDGDGDATITRRGSGAGREAATRWASGARGAGREATGRGGSGDTTGARRGDGTVGDGRVGARGGGTAARRDGRAARRRRGSGGAMDGLGAARGRGGRGGGRLGTTSNTLGAMNSDFSYLSRF